MKEEITMTRKMQVLAAIAAITVTAGLARAQNSMNAGISHAQVEQMLRSAHTVEQYQMLASYFHARQVVFEEKAQSEKQEWDRRSQITAASYQKYPRPADSSRNRYEYFTSEAQQAGDQAAHYGSLATGAR
jgi:spore cortex formation protein SpoVR/YcgB (stage V sporulation)